MALGDSRVRLAKADVVAAHGDLRAEARALFELGMLLRELNHAEEASLVFEQLEPIGRTLLDDVTEELGLARLTGDLLAEARALFETSRVLRYLGRDTEAKTVYEQARRRVQRPQHEADLGAATRALAAARTQGDRRAEADALSRQVLALEGLERPDEASAARRQYDQVARELDEQAARDRLEAARRILDATRGQDRRRREEVDALYALADALYGVGRMDEAIAAASNARRLSLEWSERFNRDRAAEAAQALATAREWGDQEAEARAGRALAAALEPLERSEEAEHLRQQYGRDHKAAADVSRFVLSLPEIVGGFAAVKLLGPFLEAFAKKLGERLGESTSDAMHRISLRLRRGQGQVEVAMGTTGKEAPEILDASERDSSSVDLLDRRHESATIVLPSDLTDDARWALIDLDATAGGTYTWDSRANKWREM